MLVVVVALAPFDWEPDPPEGADGPWPYVAVFALVFGDAVIAVLPGETTLNTASTLAAQGRLDLGWVMVAGASGCGAGRLGAVLDRPPVPTRGSRASSTPRWPTTRWPRPWR